MKHLELHELAFTKLPGGAMEIERTRTEPPGERIPEHEDRRVATMAPAEITKLKEFLNENQ